MSNGSSSSPIGVPPTFGGGGGGSDDEGCLIIVVLAIVFGIPIAALVFLYDHLGPPLFWLNGKLLLLAIIISIIPSITAAITNNLLLRGVVDVILFSICLYGTYWLIGLPYSVLWVAYGVGLIAALEIGGLLNMLHMNYTLASIKQNREGGLFQLSIEKIGKIVRYGKFVYAAIPLSILVGVIISMIRLSSEAESPRLTVTLSLSVVTLGLLLISLVEFVGMSHPYAYVNESREAELKRKLDMAYMITCPVPRGYTHVYQINQGPSSAIVSWPRWA